MPEIECSSCQQVIKDTDKFCKRCGSPVSPLNIVCSSCNTELPADSRFCSKCGSSVATMTADSVQPQHSESTNHKRCGHCDGVITDSDIFLYGHQCPHCDNWNDNIKNA